MGTSITGLPGYRSSREFSPRRVRRSDAGLKYLDGGVIINGTYSGDSGNTGYVDVLRPGKVMAKITATGKYVNPIVGKSNAAYTGAGTVTSLTVTAAVATEIARLIAAAGASFTGYLVGPPSAAGTVAATALTVSAASGTTLTISDIAVDKVTDSLIVRDDVSDGTWCLVDDDDFILLSDQSGTRIDQAFRRPLIGGVIDASQIIDWPADTSTQDWLKGKLSTTTGMSQFNFDDDA